jgi:Domain of unknown function (DUF4424)/YARHG domain
MTKGSFKSQHSRPLMFVLVLLLLVLLHSRYVIANEMPIEGFPANGIVVRNERNIQIEREDLYIRSNRIEVAYIFRNDSDKDISSMVAFPIPLHEYGTRGDMPWDIEYPLHADFKVEVNGTPQKYDEYTRALINGKDFTDTLKRLNISIKDFNQSHWGGPFDHKFYEQNEAVKKKLTDAGVVVFEEPIEEEHYPRPAWSVETTYFWHQIFPAKSTIQVTLSYKPNRSHTQNPAQDKVTINRNKLIDPKSSELSEVLCLNDELKKWEKKRKTRMFASVVDYILTTANHWKKPIKEFHLIIEADTRWAHNERVSTCFEQGQLKKITDYRYEATINNFEPKDEIGVYFISYPDESLQPTPLTPAERLLDEDAAVMIRFYENKNYEGNKRLYVADDILYQRSTSGDRFLIQGEIIKRLNAKVLRNEIYARHGRIFAMPDMIRVFDGVPWYQPRSEFKESELNEIEKKNIDFIRELERKNGWN